MDLAQVNSAIKSKNFSIEITDSYTPETFAHGSGGEFAKLWVNELGGVKILLGRFASNERVWVELGPQANSKVSKREQKAREKELSEKNVNAMRISTQIWVNSLEEQIWDEDGEYLTAKGLKRPQSGCLLLPAKENNTRYLMIPLMDEHGAIWNLQTIGENGGPKLFKSEGRTTGLFHKLEGSADKILLCEGFATGLALNQATGFLTYVAFSCMNLKSVLIIILKTYNAENILICADWDGQTFEKTLLNPGMKAAVELGDKYNIQIARPAVNDPKLNIDFADNYKTSPELVRIAVQNPLYANQIPEKFDQQPLKPKSDTKKKKDKPLMAEPEQIEKQKDVLKALVGNEPVVSGPKADYSYIIEPPRKSEVSYDTLRAELLPDKTRKGIPLATLSNYKFLCDHVGATLRYNVIKKDTEWFIPGEVANVDNYKNVLRGRFIDLCVRAQLPKSVIDDYTDYLSEQNQFNPVVSWVTCKPWDGVDRLEDLYNTVKVTGQDTDPNKMRLKKVLLKKWLTMAIKAAFSPNGIEASGMLVFQGKQGVGKTKWFMSLTPKELKLSEESKVLNPADKDSVKQTVRFWLVELGEIGATFRKSDIEALKAFITKGFDIFRPAYARYESEFVRRTIFFGSVNPKTFLVDQTGNRRYWTLSVDEVDYQHSIDTQQLWAQVLDGYKSGDKCYLTKEEEALLNESNESFEAPDPIEEKLASLYDWSVHGKNMTATALAEEIGITEPTRADVLHVSTAAHKLSGIEIPRRGKGRMLWVGKKLR